MATHGNSYHGARRTARVYNYDTTNVPSTTRTSEIVAPVATTIRSLSDSSSPPSPSPSPSPSSSSSSSSPDQSRLKHSIYKEIFDTDSSIDTDVSVQIPQFLGCEEAVGTDTRKSKKLMLKGKVTFKTVPRMFSAKKSAGVTQKNVLRIKNDIM